MFHWKEDKGGMIFAVASVEHVFLTPMKLAKSKLQHLGRKMD